MKYQASSPSEYIAQLPESRQEIILKLRKTILDNLPKGFEEQLSYGMLGYVVPLSKYPEGYRSDPKLPLPFINLASQKNFVALYHSGIYADKKLKDWFVSQYAEQCSTKIDMGKCCIRFKYFDDIPFGLIGELCRKISADQWVALYGKNVKNHRKKQREC